MLAETTFNSTIKRKKEMQKRWKMQLSGEHINMTLCVVCVGWNHPEKRNGPTPTSFHCTRYRSHAHLRSQLTPIVQQSSQQEVFILREPQAICIKLDTRSVKETRENLVNFQNKIVNCNLICVRYICQHHVSDCEGCKMCEYMRLHTQVKRHTVQLPILQV